VLDATVFLSQLDLTWEDHCEQLSTIRNIFLYLDRYTSNLTVFYQPMAYICYINRSYALESSNGVKALLDLGNLLFRQELDNYPDLVHKMVSTMLLTIERIRGNTSSAALSSSGTAGSGTNFADNQMLNDLEVIGRLSSMLLRLGLYHTLFEKVFFEASRVFFEAEGKGLIHSIDVSRFLLLVDKRLYEAIEFTSKYIDLTSRKTLLEIIEHSLLKPHINVLMERGLFLLIDEADAVSTRKDDLKRMFLLFERVGALDVLKTGWSHYIK
jgi:cullin-4